MIPGHIRAQPLDPQRSHVTLRASASSYLPGQLVTVTVRSSRDFMGFLLQARGAGVGVREKTGVGGGVRSLRLGPVLVGGSWTLTPPGTHTLRCLSEGDTLTHSDKQLKRNLSFVWRAPDVPMGDIRFYITVVQSYFIYWAGIESTVVHDGTHNPWSMSNMTGVDGRNLALQGDAVTALPVEAQRMEDTTTVLPDITVQNSASHHSLASLSPLEVEEMKIKDPEPFTVPEMKDTTLDPEISTAATPSTDHSFHITNAPRSADQNPRGPTQDQTSSVKSETTQPWRTSLTQSQESKNPQPLPNKLLNALSHYQPLSNLPKRQPENSPSGPKTTQTSPLHPQLQTTAPVEPSPAPRRSLYHPLTSTSTPVPSQQLTLGQRLLIQNHIKPSNPEPNLHLPTPRTIVHPNSEPHPNFKLNLGHKLKPNLPNTKPNDPPILLKLQNTQTPRHSAWELGMLLGCSAGLGMVWWSVVGVRYMYRQACGKRTEVTLNDREMEYGRGERG
ncbi:hypothetical protein D5F01_LYC23011 [Larimichthys crocea]|uniref:Reelin domain-containing protein n=1 Tax=Larimichthys crocea TaxID=215358 RepID=A0A6G0HK63_LARCR|nr:hypothetical protein D5F01_LYC23011 [Larimichthys crocea]